MIVLLLIVGFSAWNTGNNLLFLVLSFLIAAMVVAFFAGSLCLKKLDVTMRFPETIFAGEPTPILVTLTNRKRIFPAFSVVAEVRGKERERSIVADELDAILPRWIAMRLGRPALVRRTLGHFVHVGAGKTAEARNDHIFPNRGRLIIRDFELSTKFPFGFFRHRRRLPAREAELIVFPTIAEIDSDIDNIPLDLGKRSSSRRGVGRDLLSLRDYQAQDDLRHIDWKATARTSQLTVREFAAEDEQRVTVILDTLTGHDRDERRALREKLAAEQSGKPVIASLTFEQHAGLAASVLTNFAANHAEIRLAIDGDVGEFGSGRVHLNESLKRLALADPTFFDAATTPELASDIQRILNSSDDSHRFLVTSNGGHGVPPELRQTLKIIGF